MWVWFGTLKKAIQWIVHSFPFPTSPCQRTPTPSITMRLSLISTVACLLSLTSFTHAAKNSLTVHITNKSDFVSKEEPCLILLFPLLLTTLLCWPPSPFAQCFILPKVKQSIGDAEHPGGLKAYCTKPISGQGSLPADMFTNGGPHIKRGNGHGAYKQITGCFNPRKISTLQPNDDGGQVCESQASSF